MWFKRPLGIYEVTIHLDGRHPYLTTHELDMETRNVVLNVPARDWNHAAEVGMRAAYKLRSWRYSVVGIRQHSEARAALGDAS